MLSGMFVPHGSAGGSAQNFFVWASRKEVSGMLVPFGSAGGSVQNFFVRASRKKFSGMLVPLGSAGGYAQNFFVWASRKYLECPFLLDPLGTPQKKKKKMPHISGKDIP